MRKCSSVDTEKVFVFPEEMLAEILSWLEAKYLLRFKCVCKEWYATISGKLLVDMHAIRNGSLHSDWIQEEILLNYKYCRGLFLERTEPLAPSMPSTIYRIRNPTTKHILNLPCPPKGVLLYMHIFQYPSTSSYYVVSIFSYKGKKKNYLALLDLGGQSDNPCPNADLSWRILKISDFDKCSRPDLYNFSYCMSSEGILHILTSLKVGLCNPKILCVDLVNQTCKILKVPQNLLFYSKELKFQSWIDKPSVVFVREEKLNVWVLEDYKKQKWADPMVIPLPFLKQNPNWTPIVPHIHRDDGDEEVVLFYSPPDVFCSYYKLKSESMFSGPPPCQRVLATLVSLKGMQPEKKEC